MFKPSYPFKRFFGIFKRCELDAKCQTINIIENLDAALNEFENVGDLKKLNENLKDTVKQI